MVFEQYKEGNSTFEDDHEVITRRDIVEKMYLLLEDQLKEGIKLKILRHMLGLFSNQPGAKFWRSYISQNSSRDKAGVEVLQNALDRMIEIV